MFHSLIPLLLAWGTAAAAETDTLVFAIDSLPLCTGTFSLNVAVRSAGELVDQIAGAHRFRVDGNKLSVPPVPAVSQWNSIILPHSWHLGSILSRQEKTSTTFGSQ